MKKIIVFLLTLSILCIFPIAVLADEEPTSEVSTSASEEESSDPEQEHIHSWEVINFDGVYNVVTLKCSGCGAVTTLNFTECLTNFDTTSPYFSAVDINHDLVINGRDYAYLVRGFTNLLDAESFNYMFSAKEFLYKESFFYIYLTVMFVISTGVICYSVRRAKN